MLKYQRSTGAREINELRTILEHHMRQCTEQVKTLALQSYTGKCNEISLFFNRIFPWTVVSTYTIPVVMTTQRSREELNEGQWVNH